jgi:DNA-binding response OmpR family regulator
MRGRVLIVDDEETTRDAISEYFQAQGYEADSAREAEEAEALLTHVRYDAIVSDLRLTRIHGAEGLEIVAYVKERCPWTRIILLTAHATPELEIEALRRGVDYVLTKPQPLARLVEVVAAGRSGGSD